MKKPKNLYVRPMDMNQGREMMVQGGYREGEIKGRKNGSTVIA